MTDTPDGPPPVSPQRGTTPVAKTGYLLVFSLTLVVTALTMAAIDCLLDLISYGSTLLEMVPDEMGTREFLKQQFLTCTTNTMFAPGVLLTGIAAGSVTSLSTYYLANPEAALSDFIPESWRRGQ